MSASPCADCGADTTPRTRGRITGQSWEWYMATDETWAAAGMGDDGFLCVGCLEARLGRELQSGDFTGAPVNVPGLMPDTPRLAERKARGAACC